ncbi:MAG TPA: zf-HC2 domain-containing protein [Gammaproteobacteria bacterium]|nr:zf-HC2 domain-containing protein [Gammaproteobacteria bacterium]
MRSCKQISFLVSESQDRKLSFREWLSVKVHLQMCKACEQMARQIKLLRVTSTKYMSSEDHKSNRPKDHLSKEASDRIRKRLFCVSEKDKNK